MSELRVDNIVDMGGSGAPQLRKGASVTGISTITQAVIGNTTINAGGINATGIVTSSSNKFVGDLASGNITAGVMTATSSVVASNITINSGGVNASGIVSATSYTGSGANLTGIGLSIAPLAYNPPVSGVDASLSTGIGLTFNQRVSAGTGNVTLSLVSVGSTLVENFSVGSSVTYNNDADPPNITITPTNALTKNTVYAINYPPGAFTQSGTGGSFVGTAYTFDSTNINNTLWAWGNGWAGQPGLNSQTEYSSPVQVGSDSTWDKVLRAGTDNSLQAIQKTDGSTWVWGYAADGRLGLGDEVWKSSPTQLPGNWHNIGGNDGSSGGTKTDGTLWTWGGAGAYAHNNTTQRSSPVQVGSDTTWSIDYMDSFTAPFMATKTDGTLWMWGGNTYGILGQNSRTTYSSPIQVGGGTDWKRTAGTSQSVAAIKTNGTLWVWGRNNYGQLGQNNTIPRSSPVQIPGTTWNLIRSDGKASWGIKTDGTLWAWGENNNRGWSGQNNNTNYSSPIQIPGTTWVDLDMGDKGVIATKTDGTLWSWGYGAKGALGQNQGAPSTLYSSPVQIPGTNWSTSISAIGRNGTAVLAIKT